MTMVDDSNRVAGFLLTWPGGPIPRELLEDVLRPLGDLAGIPRWERYALDSPPIFGEEVEDGATVNYQVIARRSGGKMILVGVAGLVEHVVDKGHLARIRPALRRVPVAVDALIRDIAERPGDFAISYAHGRSPGFGARMRSVSYYGDDISEASLFRESLPLLVFSTCGLRRVARGSEIMKFGSDGSVSFRLDSRRRASEVERVLSYLRDNGYLRAVPTASPNRNGCELEGF